MCASHGLRCGGGWCYICGVTPFPWSDVLVIAALVAVNALFACTELAIVSARHTRLRIMADDGNRGAVAALALVAEPGRFLSTVQTGITLIGILAGAYSGVSLGGPLGERLAALGLPAAWAPEAGFVVAILLTTYVNLVFGELVPKRLALRAPEQIACAAARPMALFARAFAPLVWLLDRSSTLLLTLLGVRGPSDRTVSEEEVRLVMAEATRAGAIEEDEHALMAGILRLADRPVRAMMTPRTEIDTIDLHADAAAIRAAIAASPHSLLPVIDGEADNIVGVVRGRDLLARLLAGEVPDLAGMMRAAPTVPDQIDAIDGLRILRRAGVGMALVHDEYGHLEGLVTPADLLDALLGDFASNLDDGAEVPIIEEDNGALLVAGGLDADVLAERLGLTLPETHDYATAAGFALAALKRLPQVGEAFEAEGWRCEIAEMAGRRIVRLRITPVS